VRIVAGKWRGRRIKPPADERVRPTADRVREAWMSILQDDLPGARVIDLFAGSGALGLEALSRGAVSAVFVEKGARSLRALRENAIALEAEDEIEIHRADAV
jgi:16S rRNA (guanine966-N2)-methyltransferase